MYKSSQIKILVPHLKPLPRAPCHTTYKVTLTDLAKIPFNGAFIWYYILYIGEKMFPYHLIMLATKPLPLMLRNVKLKSMCALARSSKTAFLSTVKGKRIARERERSA